ncbi:sugar ABC transporter permease [Actinoallomurus vinaceus]|uniref:Sugar ABC transporter permease n=1 Tax=Actinoallomurus vinaceus TaxID=1080074 RepID=A0ABP8UMW4_9ACTN
MTGVAADASPAGRRRRFTDRDGPLAWAFLLPSIVYLTALVAVPLGLTVAFGLSDATAADPTYRFAGGRWFATVLGEGAFWRSLGDTLLITGVSTVLVVLLGQVLAHVLLADLRGRWLIRVLVLLPWTTPVALSAISWRWLLDHPGSPAGRVLRAAGVPPGDTWHERPATAMAAVVVVHVWRLAPLAAVLVMAGTAAIPREIRDAARVDGAGPWRRAFEVTIPLTLPATTVAALVTATVVCADVTVVDLLTGGGPAGSTQTLASLALARGADGGAVGPGAAIAVLSLPLPLAGVVGLIRVLRRS